MPVDLSNMFRYPSSKLLGNLPCGKTPTPPEWLEVGAKANFPPYKGAPHENCGNQKGCTPRLRFYDGDNDLAMSRKILKQSNNRAIGEGPLNPTYTYISPLNYNTPFSRDTIIAGSGDPIALPQTPFRLLMNAADALGSNNAYVMGNKADAGNGVSQLYTNAINQVSSTRRASNAAAVRMSGVVPLGNPNATNDPVNNNVSLWSGNNKWVYDGADYVRFKKLQAKNRNFNDVSWGGDRNNASQTALSRVRR